MSHRIASAAALVFAILAANPVRAQPVLLVSNGGADSVVEFLVGNVPVAYATGFGLPLGMAVDSSKNLYVADTSNPVQQVLKVPPYGGVASPFAAVANPIGVAIDTTGNLYVASGGGNSVSKITPAGAVSVFATGLNTPQGLAIDGNGNLFVANAGSNTVSKVAPNGAVSTFASGFDGPAGLAFDGSGNLYVANALGNLIDRVSPSGSVSVFATLSSAGGIGDRPEGLTFASDGNLYVACNATNSIKQITPSGIVTSVLGNLNSPYFIVPSPVPEPSALFLVGAAAAPALMRRLRMRPTIKR